MDNRMLYAFMTLFFNSYGVPCFMRGDVKTGVLRIVLAILTFGVIGVINFVMGIVLAVRIFKMSDADFYAQRNTLVLGVPRGN